MRSLSDTNGILRAAGTALAAYALPWGLALVGWSFSALTDAPEAIVERLAPPIGVFLTLELSDDGATDEDGDGPDEVDEDGDDDVMADVAVDPVPSRPGHEGTADADDEPDGGADVLVAPDGAPVAGAGGTGEVGDGEGRKAGAVTKKRRKPSRCLDPHPHVREGTDGVVEVDRALVEEYTRNLESFMKLGYSRPYDEDGVKGWYISGFSCTSPVHKAGFRRGDVLLTVNGKKTRTWVGVFLMYQKLKKKDDFEVALVRKGQPMTLSFRVVD